MLKLYIKTEFPHSLGHLLEDLRLDGNTVVGILISGNNHLIRNNQIINTGPTDISSAAIGIRFDSVKNTQIIGNIISGVSETDIAYGISISNSSLIDVHDNAIYDMKDATSKRGVYIATTNSNITISGNRVLNVSGTGTSGIIDVDSASTHCIDNIVSGYNTAFSGCDFLSGNVTP